MTELEQTLDFTPPQKKIYEERSFRIATFLGGPLVAGYLLAENFKAFNEPGKAKKAWFYSILTTLLLFCISFFVPGIDKIPSVIFPIVYTAIAYYLVQTYQGEKIKAHLLSGGEAYKWWRALLIGLLGMAILLVVIFCLVYFLDIK